MLIGIKSLRCISSFDVFACVCCGVPALQKDHVYVSNYALFERTAASLSPSGPVRGEIGLPWIQLPQWGGELLVQRGGSVGDASLNVNPKLLVSTFPSSRADVNASGLQLLQWQSASQLVFTHKTLCRQHSVPVMNNDNLSFSLTCTMCTDVALWALVWGRDSGWWLFPEYTQSSSIWTLQCTSTSPCRFDLILKWPCLIFVFYIHAKWPLQALLVGKHFSNASTSEPIKWIHRSPSEYSFL